MSTAKGLSNGGPHATVDLATLTAYAAHTQSLLTTLQQSLTHQTPNPSTTLSESQKLLTNPFSLLRDASALLKAHTTKLSLMIINKPFSPKAIYSELKSSVEHCIMAMMSALEVVEAGVSVRAGTVKGDSEVPGSPWGTFTSKEVRLRVGRVVREMRVLVQEVAKVCEEESRSSGDDNKLEEGRGTLASTGVVWEACDALGELERLGVPGLVVYKAQQFYHSLKDAIAELKEWSLEAEDENNGDDEEEDVSENDVDPDFDHDFDDIFSAANKLPKGNTALREQLDTTIKKLQLVSVLYQALLKRRLKTFPFTADMDSLQSLSARERMKALNELYDLLQEIPETVDELACAFYDLNGDMAAELSQSIISQATLSISLVRQSWAETDDEFTAWSAKWLENVRT